MHTVGCGRATGAPPSAPAAPVYWYGVQTPGRYGPAYGAAVAWAEYVRVTARHTAQSYSPPPRATVSTRGAVSCAYKRMGSSVRNLSRMQTTPPAALLVW